MLFLLWYDIFIAKKCFDSGDAGARGANCVIIRYLTSPLAWRWNDRNCETVNELFVCELPRVRYKYTVFLYRNFHLIE